ncbi:urea transporter [Paenibacillus sp. FA6]|uniref:urea transporter n=1 Tax=Paenibacillus sp. FA6 TaxID=3413029 RepID=UPI003F660748
MSKNSGFSPLIPSSLKGISQVILIENAVTGLFVLVAITLSSYLLGIVTLASALIGTWIARVCGANETTVKQGLFSFNSVLTGIALTLNLNGSNRWILALAGAAVTVLVTAALMYVMRNSGLPVLTFPYIILTWFILLAPYKLENMKLNPDLVPQNLSAWKLSETDVVDWKYGLIRGIGQVYFLDNVWCGILILFAIFWASRRLGLYAILGNFIAWLTAYGLGAEVELLNMGLYGYNAVLTIFAVEYYCGINHRSTLLMGIFGAMISVPITASVGTFLSPYGLPSLTMPFLLSTWLILSARKILTKLTVKNF